MRDLEANQDCKWMNKFDTKTPRTYKIGGKFGCKLKG